MDERKRRHRWEPLPDFPTRDDIRVCTREDCGMHRRDTGVGRYEYRTNEGFKFIANRKKSWPAPPCGPTEKETTP